MHDPGDVACVVVGDSEARADHGRPLLEKHERGVPHDDPRPHDPAWLDHWQRLQPPNHLAIDGERFPAGGDHDDIWAAPRQLLSEVGCRFEHLFTVVQNDQCGLVREVVEHHLLEAAAPHLRKVQHRCHSARDTRPVSGGSQLDQPGAVGEVVHDVKGDLNREPRFANPSNADDGDESGPSDQRGQRGPLLGAADEAGPVERHVVVNHPLGSERWEVRWKLRVVYLEEAGGRGEPPQLKGAKQGQAHVRREPCPHVRRGRLGKHDLAAMRPGTDPCGLMQAK